MTESRRTTQQHAVQQALAAAEGFISAQELHRRLVASGDKAGLATVYRQLNALVASGDVDTIPIAGGLLYRACAPGKHHHHLVCEQCGKAVTINPPAEEWIRTAAEENGFVVTGHLVEIFGRCRECAESEGAP